MNTRLISDVTSNSSSTRYIQELLQKHSSEIKEKLDLNSDCIAGMNFSHRRSFPRVYKIRAICSNGSQLEAEIEVKTEKQDIRFEESSELKSIRLVN